MAKTNAENQAAYKNRHLKDVSGTSERLDVLTDVSAKIALKRLAKHYRVISITADDGLQAVPAQRGRVKLQAIALQINALEHGF